MSFRALRDHELDQLDDERLIAYVRAARDAGRSDLARRGLAILVYGYERNVMLRMRLKVPAEAVEDLAHDALVRAIGSAFDGSSVGEFRSWLGVISDRTVADFYRRRARKPIEEPLPSGSTDSEDWVPEPSADSDSGAVETHLVIDEVLASFNDTHQTVIKLHIFDGLTAAEVSGKVDGMSQDNVAQIATRFRLRLRAQLEAEGGA